MDQMLQPKDTDWLNGYKDKTPYTCCLQETHFRPTHYKRHVLTESKKMGKDIPCKWKSKESQKGQSHFRQNRLYFFFKIDFKIRNITIDKKDST